MIENPLNIGALGVDSGLSGLFLSSLLSATVLPGSSELVLFALLKLHPEQLWPALAWAALGNTIGGMISYACGRWLPRWQKFENSAGRERAQRWGAPILLLSWVPVIGDALCIGAGWLRLNWLNCAIFMAVGKVARYWVVAQGAIW